jgi:hypothetical protein
MMLRPEDSIHHQVRRGRVAGAAQPDSRRRIASDPTS